jgi:cytochrome c biogenesis factor
VAGMGLRAGEAGAGDGGLSDMDNGFLSFFSVVLSLAASLYLLKRKAHKKQSGATEEDSEEVAWKEKMSKDTLIVLGIVFFGIAALVFIVPVLIKTIANFSE